VAPNPIVRWDIRPGENPLDVLEAAGAHLAGEGRRIVSWSEYAGELVLIVEDHDQAPEVHQNRVRKPPVTR
jgi:prophage tail gpP-like protein